VDNSVAQVTLEKSWVHNFIKSQINERKILGNKKKWISVGLNLVIKVYIALCIVR